MADERYVVRANFSDTDQEFEIDLLNLTAKERIELEEFFEEPWADLWASGWLLRSTKGAVFIGYLARRRKEETFTLRDALDSDADAIEVNDEGGKRPTKTRAKGGTRS